MARPTKEGLEYFPTDVDIFDDPKLLFVTTKFGDYGDLIAVKLLTWIYKQGYKIDWNEEMLLLFTARSFKNIDPELVQKVVTELINRDFFSREIFEKFGVLTSRGIQKRWIHVQRSYKRKAKILDRLNLVELEETTDETEETNPTEEETTPTTEFSTQKESKVKEKKVNKKETHFFWKETIELFKSHTRIENPNPEKHIEPILNFFDSIPEHLSSNDIAECITLSFKPLNKSSGVKMEYLLSNIQAKITAKHEETLLEMKKPALKEAEIERNAANRRLLEENKRYQKEKIQEYKTFVDKNLHLFNQLEKEKLLRLLNENKLLEAGTIIEPKMESVELA